LWGIAALVTLLGIMYAQLLTVYMVLVFVIAITSQNHFWNSLPLGTLSIPRRVTNLRLGRDLDMTVFGGAQILIFLIAVIRAPQKSIRI
jgi:hypothetical protein